MFYGLDSSRVTVREYRWGTSVVGMPLVLLLKLLRVRLPSSTDDPCVETLAPFEVDALPASLQDTLAEPLAALAALGFTPALVHGIDDTLHRTQTWLLALRHPTGRAVARVHVRIWAHHSPPKVVVFHEFVTPIRGERWLWSLSSKPDLLAPPTCTVVRVVGALPADLWAAHQRALATRTPARPVATVEAVRETVERLHAAVRDFHLQRGVFRPLSVAEKADVRHTEQHLAEAGAVRVEHPEVLAEIERLQRGQGSAANTILVLAASLGLFLFANHAGGASSPSSFPLADLLILVPILFVHESGHWLAMKIFGYRNLKMFFIPFFGAAVTGRHYNVPGWKKAVVSLMGPLPGVVAGAVIGVLGLILHRPLLVKIGVMALGLNGFNLLPMLPLDGGWVMHAILFSRHVALDVVFRGLAALGMLALALASGDKVLLFVMLAMLLALPASYRLARITAEARRSGLSAASPDDTTIRPDVADALAGRVKAAFAGRATTKVVAQHTLTVFESLNARPPGLAASLALGTVHGCALVAAFVFLVLLSLAPKLGLGGIASFGGAMGAPPAHTVAPVAVSAATVTGDHGTLVATFASAREAQDAQAEPRGAGLAVGLLGDTLLVVLPPDDDAARRRWLAAFQPRAKDVFVVAPGSVAGLRLTAVAAGEDAARDLAEETLGYLVGVPADLIPPWLAPDPRTPEEQDRHRRARRTLARLQRMGSVYGSPRLADLRKAIADAQRQGDTAGVARLRAEQKQLVADLQREAWRDVRNSAGAVPEVVDRYAKLTDGAEDAQRGTQMSAELGPLLGSIAGWPSAERAAAARQGGQGYVMHDGASLTFHVRFPDPAVGPVALVRWLHAQGLRDVRYEFTGAMGADAADEGEDD